MVRIGCEDDDYYTKRMLFKTSSQIRVDSIIDLLERHVVINFSDLINCLLIDYKIGDSVEVIINELNRLIDNSVIKIKPFWNFQIDKLDLKIKINNH